jgi:hypothetical protein
MVLPLLAFRPGARSGPRAGATPARTAAGAFLRTCARVPGAIRALARTGRSLSRGLSLRSRSVRLRPPSFRRGPRAARRAGRSRDLSGAFGCGSCPAARRGASRAPPASTSASTCRLVRHFAAALLPAPRLLSLVGPCHVRMPLAFPRKGRSIPARSFVGLTRDGRAQRDVGRPAAASRVNAPTITVGSAMTGIAAHMPAASLP